MTPSKSTLECPLLLAVFCVTIAFISALCWDPLQTRRRPTIRIHEPLDGSARTSKQHLLVTGSLLATLAPETTPAMLSTVEHSLSNVFGSSDSSKWHERRLMAQSISLGDGSNHTTTLIDNIDQHELVYGELGISSLVKILDAVGVQKGDEFLDIGAGHGMLVMAASLLYPDYLNASRGLEIVPELHKLSEEYRKQLQGQNRQHLGDPPGFSTCPSTELYLGDIYDPDTALKEMLSTTNLVVCFATTWSRGNDCGIQLPKLSRALQAGVLASDARIVVIDGKLLPEDGHVYHGELRLDCPDTAPYSTAYLYKYQS